MKAYLWFWGAFLLFFALPFPCILYFGTSWPVALADRSAPWLSLLLHFLLLGPPRALHRVRSILADG